MREISGALDSSDFEGNTILLECENNEYVYISGLEIFKIKPDDKIIDYISLMSHNMVPYAILIGEKYTYFISHHYKFIENDRIEEGTLLNGLNPFAYHLVKCGGDGFKTLERSQIHTFWPGVGGNEDVVDVLVEEGGDLIETIYWNGTKEVVKIFN